MRDELIHRARELIEGAGLVSVRVRALEALEARPPAQWNKGRAAMYILRTVRPNVDAQYIVDVVFLRDLSWTLADEHLSLLVSVTR